MSSARSVSTRLDAGHRERGVQADLVGRQRLHLDELGHPVAAGDAGDDVVGGRCVGGAVHVRAGGLGGRLELVQQLVEAIEGVVLDAPRLLAELLEVGQLRDGRGAARTDRPGSPAEGWRATACWRAPCAPRPGSRGPGSRAGLRAPWPVRPAGARSSAARICARCTARTIGPPAGAAGASRLSPPPMCSRHDGSTAVAVCPRPVATTLPHFSASMASDDVGVLDREGAAEATTLGRLRQLQQLEPAYVREQPLRRVADARHPLRVAGRVQGDAADTDAPTSSTPRRRTRNSENSKSLSAERLRVPRELLLPGLARHARQQLAHPAHARRRRRDDRVHAVVPAHHVHERPRQAQRVVTEAAVDVHLPVRRMAGHPGAGGDRRRPRHGAGGRGWAEVVDLRLAGDSILDRHTHRRRRDRRVGEQRHSTARRLLSRGRHAPRSCG